MKETDALMFMHLDNEGLKKLILEVAKKQFGEREFNRRPLMLAVEKEVRVRALWTEEDDALSGSVGVKSKGLANLDWRITNLKNEGRLKSLGRHRWHL
ncbi:MAG TPA: hypothetical protein VGF13_05130 [Verrucomicrobiae bacterium]